MSTLILPTKLFAPPVRPEWVPRPRLLDQVDRGAGRTLTLVSAPAGTGKTALAAAWLDHYRDRRAWLSLDEGDNDPVRFVSYLIAAMQRIHPQIGLSVRPTLQALTPPPVDSLAALLITDLVQAEPGGCALVLDDYQYIQNSQVHDFMTVFLERKPPNLHVILLSRHDPLLPVARWRVRGDLVEIRDLSFTPDETADFLNGRMGLDLDADLLDVLGRRTEGWIAGLHLAALSLRQHADRAAFIATFSGSHRHLIDYLAEEVLHTQPEPVRAFLRQTAILNRLSAPLCNAVTGRDDGDSMLKELEHANLFVVPLDERREWFRYHAFFAEFLLTTLDAAQEADLHRRALLWYESAGLIHPAIHHALRCAALCGDWDHAERLIVQAAGEAFHTGAMVTLGGWLDALPEDRVRANGLLATYKAWALALAGDIEAAEDYGRSAERNLTTAPDVGILRVWQCSLALVRQDYEQTARLGRLALDALPASETRWRVIVLWAIAEVQERTQPITEAIATLRTMIPLTRTLDNQVFAGVGDSFLVEALNKHGQRAEALAVCEQALKQHTDPASGRLSLSAGMLLTRAGWLHYEANDLPRARAALEHALVLHEQLGVSAPLALTWGLLAAVLYAQGDTEAAWDALHTARQHVDGDAFSDSSWLDALETDLRLRAGDRAVGQRWIESPDEEPDYLRMESQLTLARALLAQDRMAEAARWLDRLAQFAEPRGLTRWLLTIHILAAHASISREAALDHLRQAVVLAAPGGYVRAFLDEGLLGLLPAVRSAAPFFVDRLLAADPARTSDRGQPLVEPLSERETEVLRLLAAGLSNHEIAQTLVITVGTTKRHVHSILGKLDAANRMQAVARAQTLGLVRAV